MYRSFPARVLRARIAYRNAYAHDGTLNSGRIRQRIAPLGYWKWFAVSTLKYGELATRVERALAALAKAIDPADIAATGTNQN